MADYQLSATLRLNDRGFTAGIRAAEKETSKLERGIGDLKNQKLMFQVGVEGMEKLKRYHEMMRRGGMKIPPLEISARDNATPKIQRIRQEVTSLSSKAHTVAVNIKTNGMAALKNAKSSIGEIAGGAAMGMGATMLGAAGIGYGVVNAFQSQMEFEKQMSAVKAVSGATKAEFEQLTAAAEKMGATTKFTAKEAADGLYYMSMAGWDVDKQISALPSILNLAAAGNTDLATTSDIVTDSMTGFGLKAGKMVKNAKGEMVESSKHYADLMATLVTKSNTDIAMAGETMKYAAANVGAMFANGSMEDKMRGAEDMFLMTGMMANAGIKSSQAGTTARSLFARFGSQNRNAAFALQALGVDFTDEKYGGKGEVRRIRDIFDDLRKRFQEGVSPEQILNFAETLEGTKLHADTRRKLEGFLKSAQANGGKLAGGEMLKMAAMLNGQEGMSGLLAMLLGEDWDKLTTALDDADGAAERMSKIQLDNLAGDFTMLGSAWDAFQRSFVKGEASDGLRSFVQTLTDTVTKANNLFADGIQFKDLFTLAADGITKLKNKFLELDGIGSLLAGGALMVGLRAILQTALKVKDTLSEWSKIKTASDLGNQIRGNKNLGGGLSSVGTMNIKAGVVHLTGAIQQGGGSNSSFGNNRRVGNQTRVDDYYRRRGEILAGQNSGRPTPPPSSTSRFGGLGAIAKNGLKMAGASTVFSLPFAAMDIYAAKSHSAETLAEADETVAWHKQRLEEIKSQEGVTQEQIQAQQEEIKAAEAFRQRTIEMNQQVERQANFRAAGTVVGTALGSFFGPMGAIAGGVLGDIAGSKIADWWTEKEKSDKENKTQATQNNWKGTAEATQKQISAKNNFDSKVSEINRKGIDDGLKSFKDWWGSFFKGEKSPANQGIEYQKNYQQGKVESVVPKFDYQTPTNKATNQYGYAPAQNITPFALPKFEMPEFNIGAKIQNEIDFVSNTVSAKVEGIKKSFSEMFSGFELPDISKMWNDFKFEDLLPDFNLSEWWSNKTAELPNLSEIFSGFELPNIGEFFSSFELPNLGEWFNNFELPDVSQMWNDFNFSDLLPDFNLSEMFGEFNLAEQFQNLFSGIGEIDFASMLPDFSGIGTTIIEQLSGIPETVSGIITSIGEGFSQIPTTASEAFNTISTAANEGLTAIQSAWGMLPGFFGGLFAGLGGVASGAGAAIAAGLNSGIGMIQSAWEGLSGWLSSKIASLSAMASNAAAAIGIGGIGHNAKGTSNFEGGWSEINESGGELILLPSGAKIYPHSTTKNILRHEIKDDFALSSGFVSDGGKTQRIMEDFLSSRINSRRNDIFENIRTSNILNNLRKSAVLNQSPFETLQNIFGSISKADVPNLQETKFDALGNIEGLEIPEFNRITVDDDLMVAAAKKQAQLEQLNSMQSPFNFDFDSLEIPSFDIPQATQSNTTTNNSPTNNFNFGGVNISSGMNFDEFVHRLQELFSGAVNNSELV